jgi:hypothetical protein
MQMHRIHKGIGNKVGQVNGKANAISQIEHYGKLLYTLVKPAYEQNNQSTNNAHGNQKLHGGKYGIMPS